MTDKPLSEALGKNGPVYPSKGGYLIGVIAKWSKSLSIITFPIFILSPL
jgi:hypothetical protein